jgi:hypothetical protein
MSDAPGGGPASVEKRAAALEIVLRRNAGMPEDFVTGHVRVPAYIRGKTGTVVHISPATPFPDAAAHDMQAEMEPTYDVRFRSRDLWQVVLTKR